MNSNRVGPTIVGALTLLVMCEVLLRHEVA